MTKKYQAVQAQVIDTMQFGGCPSCGRKNCIALSCRNLTHSAQPHWEDRAKELMQVFQGAPDVLGQGLLSRKAFPATSTEEQSSK
jgi:hypothetical protein